MFYLSLLDLSFDLSLFLFLFCSLLDLSSFLYLSLFVVVVAGCCNLLFVLYVVFVPRLPTPRELQASLDAEEPEDDHVQAGS